MHRYQPSSPSPCYNQPAVINLKHPFIQASSSPLVRLYLRLFPTLIALSIVSSFLTYQPELARNFINQFLSKLNFYQPVAPPPIELDLVTPVNSHRLKHNLPSLSPSSPLNTAAEYIAISLAADPDQEINLKKIATLADYSYSVIAYFASVNPLPLITSPATIWIADSPPELLDPQFTQIGTHYLNVNLNHQDQIIAVLVLASPQKPTLAPVLPTPTPSPIIRRSAPKYYTGAELWQEIQKYRREHGVPEFKQDNTLCTIASIRVNQMIELGKLDNHQGFTPLVDQFRQENRLTHTNVAENILSGHLTPQDAVAAWDGSLGHRALMRDGAYVFACTAANHGFAVLIAAF